MTSRNFRNFEFRLGKLGLVLFITGMSMLLLVVFLLGIFVGKDLDTMPAKIANDVPGTVKEKLGLASGKSETPAPSEGKDGMRSAAVDRTPEFNWTFYDTLNRKRGEEKGLLIPEREKSRRPSGKTVGTVKTETASKAADSKKDNREHSPPATEAAGKSKTSETKREPPKAVSSTAKALQEKGLVVADVGRRGEGKARLSKAGSAPSTEKPEKKPEKKKDAGGTFLVQVVSYKEKEKSELTAKKVKYLGFKAKVIPVDLASKGKWYRVIVDGFETRDKAQRVASKIRSQIQGTQCIVRAGSQNGR